MLCVQELVLTTEWLHHGGEGPCWPLHSTCWGWKYVPAILWGRWGQGGTPGMWHVTSVPAGGISQEGCSITCAGPAGAHP